MSSGILPIVKQAALDVINNSNPTDLRYGTVTSINPLTIKISNQFILPSSLLVVPQHLTTYKVDISLKWEDATDEKEALLTIKNDLKVGDKVVLIRQLGGASYLILDKI